ncbi:unnamed protein product [Adineta ricciae]|uniref:NHL repeat containing protein n=1 Tax=Adineta ricciae TaxID=249248 RepID=A0A815X643_ADIRI|nr:unnamed protein product [Adineta ricciae]
MEQFYKRWLKTTPAILDALFYNTPDEGSQTLTVLHVGGRNAYRLANYYDFVLPIILFLSLSLPNTALGEKCYCPTAPFIYMISDYIENIAEKYILEIYSKQNDSMMTLACYAGLKKICLERQNCHLTFFYTHNLAVSLNQPNLSSVPTWERNGITFVNESIVGVKNTDVFIDRKNSIYILSDDKKQIIVWHNNSINPTQTISADFLSFSSIFVTPNGDIYISSEFPSFHITRWISKTKIFTKVMNTSHHCYDIFIDINDSLYCSMSMNNQVSKVNLKSSSMNTIVVAGTNSHGSNPNELHHPCGIFVDVNFDLFVADTENNRIQLFPFGETNAITVAGWQSARPTINLNGPVGVTLDAKKYLFIVELEGQQIIAEGPYGFRCITGCYGDGYQSIGISFPSSISFDSFGNIFIADFINQRIRKFQLENLCGFPLNIPRFCSKPVWNRNGITFTDQSIIGLNPSSIFIDQKNSIYSLNQEKKQILIWNESNIESTRINLSDFSYSYSLFVALNGDIYIDDGINHRIKKWTLNTKNFTNEMDVFSSCFGLFIDRYNHLYCSMPEHHQVIKRNFSEGIPAIIIVAGTGNQGSTSTMLTSPHGIYVDTEFNTFVADCGNNRIQRFELEVKVGITEVGDSSTAQHQYSLSCPTGIALDSQRFLFIVDSNNHRILRSGTNGVHCVIGCNGISIKSTKLYSPSNLAFDNFGNMFVVDSGNNRIQKFQYSKNSCDMSSIIQWTHSLTLTKDSQLYSQDCNEENHYYESFQIEVPENRYYSIWSSADFDTSAFIYEKSFDSLHPNENLLTKDDDEAFDNQFKLELPLYNNIIYVLVVTTRYPMKTGNITIHMSSLKNVNVTRLSTLVNIQSNYSSQLTTNNPKYCQDYKNLSHYYQALQIYVKKTGLYIIWSKSEIDTYGFIYKDNFDPLKPLHNLIVYHNGACNQNQLKLFINLQENTKYIFVITTNYPNTTGNYTIFISGENHVTISHFFDSKQHNYSAEVQCQFYSTTAGLSSDSGNQFYSTTTTGLSSDSENQFYSIQISSVLIILMFIEGLINNLFILF